MSLPIDVSPEEYQKLARMIFDPVKLNECATVVGYPGCGHEYIANAILGRTDLLKALLGKYYKKYVFLPILLTQEDTASSVFYRMLDHITSRGIALPPAPTFRRVITYLIDIGLSPYIFLYKAHRVPPKALLEILTMIHDVLIETNAIGAQMYFEANIFADPILSVLQKNHKFLSNIDSIPVYSREECMFYLTSLGKLYNVPLSRVRNKDLFSMFGGNLWLLTEAVRFLRRHPKATIANIVHHPLMSVKIRIVYDLLSKREKAYLGKLIIDQDAAIPSDIRQYFDAIGLVRPEDGKDILTIPVLHDLLLQSYKAARLVIHPNGSLWYGTKHLDTILSPSEREILKLLVRHAGSLVSRDEVASALWAEHAHERYSDWAIDKTISRLRSILTRAGVPKGMLVTKKKQGFLII